MKRWLPLSIGLLLGVVRPAIVADPPAKRFFDSLITFATDADPAVADYAKQTLIRIGPPSLPHLKSAIEKRKDPRIESLVDDIRFTAERDAVAHVICVHKSSAEGKQVSVRIHNCTRPYFVVLAGGKEIHWKVTIDESSRPFLQKILIGGMERQKADVDGGAATFVGNNPFDRYDLPVSTDHSDGSFIPLRIAIYGLIGKRPIRLQGRDEYLKLPFDITDQEESAKPVPILKPVTKPQK